MPLRARDACVLCGWSTATPRRGGLCHHCLADAAPPVLGPLAFAVTCLFVGAVIGWLACVRLTAFPCRC